MPIAFKRKTCVLCGSAQSSKDGEHVLPQWLVSRLFPPEDGPYRTDRGGNPVLRRDGSIREDQSFGAIKLPACEQCNKALGRRFENPTTRALILALLDRGCGFNSANPTEIHDVALWLLKTWLLSAHPEAVYSIYAGTGRHDPAASWDASPDLYAWTVRGDPPPDSLSLWLSRAPKDNSARPVRDIPLPTVEADGESHRFLYREWGLCELRATLVHHPGWEIAHPGERDGEVVRLWPDPPDLLDLGALASDPAAVTTWIPHGRVFFAPGRYGSGSLPPLSPEIQLFGFDLFPHGVTGGTFS